MIGPVALPTLTATAVSVTASEVISGPWGQVITVAAVCTALTVIGHFTHAREIFAGLRDFLKDWHGEPARPGVPARPSMPERMASMEQAVSGVDTRVTNHRERNEQTIAALQAAVDALGRDQFLVDTARAIITELGHDGELPVLPHDLGGASGDDRQPPV